jgi:D-sedoheptulose 7-phosphate isomerase
MIIAIEQALEDARLDTDGAIAIGSVINYLDEFRELLAKLDTEEITRIVQTLVEAYRLGTRVFVLGNGGSAATASHFACDLGKGVIGADGHRFKVLALTDNIPLLTAWANDTSYERIFVEQLDAFLQSRDVVVAISASGNSPNVLRAMELARSRRAITVGLTGFEGGQLKTLCDICLVVPSRHMDQIEDAHLAVQHLVCRSLRELLTAWPDGAASRLSPSKN